MKYLIAGGSGLVGRALTDGLKALGHEVKWISRTPKGPDQWGWNAADLDQALAWADGVANLAGEPVAGKWTPAKKKSILESRVQATVSLVEAIRRSAKKPVVLVNASACGYYGSQGDVELDESSPAGPAGDLLSQTCRETEAETAKAGPAGVRVCLARTGLVLSRQGGVLKKMLPLFKLGFGGPLGPGTQWMPWIHVRDEAGLLIHLLTKAGLRGAFNLCAPSPVTNANFSSALNRALGKGAGWALPFGLFRFMFGQGADMLLASQRAVSKKVTETGYVFKFPDLESAFTDLLAKS